MPPCYLHLDLPKHDIRYMSRFRLQAHTLAVEFSIWRAGTTTVTSVPVLLFKMRCMFFLTVKTALSGKSALSLSPLSAKPFLWKPLIFHMPYLVKLSLISLLNSTTKSAIPFRTL